MSGRQNSTPSEAMRSERLAVPTVVETLVQALRSLIMAGSYRPGDRLIEEPIAERFGVSRPPVREALRVLQRDGIVTSVPRKGFIVVPITPQDVREIYDLRFALERTAVELSVPLDDLDRLAPLRAALDIMRAEAAQNDPDLMLEANSTFHFALVGLAGNSRLLTAYSSLRMQLQMCMAMNLKFRQQFHNDPQDVVRRHEELVTLIEDGDLEALLHALQNHGDRSFLARLDDLIAPAS
jgi:DNA-binding GntR family transcriptional regulator